MIRTVSLCICIACLVSACTTPSERVKEANVCRVYSKTAGQRNEALAERNYCALYQEGVSDAVRREVAEAKTWGTSGIVSMRPGGFKVGFVEVDYAVSKAGVMTVE